MEHNFKCFILKFLLVHFEFKKKKKKKVHTYACVYMIHGYCNGYLHKEMDFITGVQDVYISLGANAIGKGINISLLPFIFSYR